MHRAVVGRIDVDVDPIRLRVPQPRIGETPAQRRQPMQASTDQLAEAPAFRRRACRTGVQHRRPRHVEVVGRRLQVEERRIQTAQSLHCDDANGASVDLLRKLHPAVTRSIAERRRHGPPRQWSMRWWSGLNPCSMPHRMAWDRVVTPILRYAERM